MDVIFSNETETEFSEKIYELIEKAIEAALKELKISEPVEISVTITDNENIKELNREYRDNDSATDVLSFPMIDLGRIINNDDIKKQNIFGQTVPFGDIVISYQRAQEQAEEYGHGLERELAFLTVHSMLHLAGYDHMTEKEEIEMFALQELILNHIGLKRE